MSQAPPAEQPAQRLILTGSFDGGVEVRSDPAAFAARIEGPHEVLHQGSTVTVRGHSRSPGAAPGASNLRASAVVSGAASIVLEVSTGRAAPVIISVPSSLLELSADLPAATMTLRGLSCAAHLRLGAGSLMVADPQGSLNARLQAGTVDIQGTPRRHSYVACQAGTVDIRLRPDVAVSVDATCKVGEVLWPQDLPAEGDGANRLKVRVGAGLVRLACQRSGTR